MKAMKSLLPVVALTVGLLLSAAQTPTKPWKVLIIDGQNNHQWAATTPVIKHALESCGRFSVTVSTSPKQGSEAAAWDAWRPNFSEYAAVVSNYNGELWPKPVQESFEAFVKDGGAFVSVHAANNSFPEWPAYNEMIGLGGWGGRNETAGPLVYFRDGKEVRDASPGAGGTHGAQWEFNVNTVDAEHPITKGLPASWKHAKDELYATLRGPARNLHVLATATSKKTERDEPMLMTVDYGKGRVFHTTLGHADYSMRCVGFYTTLQRGTEWAITGQVSLPLAANFPTADKVSPVAP